MEKIMNQPEPTKISSVWRHSGTLFSTTLKELILNGLIRTRDVEDLNTEFVRHCKVLPSIENPWRSFLSEEQRRSALIQEFLWGKDFQRIDGISNSSLEIAWKWTDKYGYTVIIWDS